MQLPKESPERWIENSKNKKTMRHEDFIAGLSKGLAILDCFANDRHRLNVSMAAEKTGLTRAAARRHLLTLEYLGYLECDGHYYYLTPKVLKFSGAYLNAAQLPKTAQPLLNLLTQQTSLIYSVMVLDDFEAITVARSAAHQHADRVNPYGLHLGNRLPAHATSAGKILLSFLPEQQQHDWLNKYPLKSLTKYTQSDSQLFLSSLENIRNDEYCYSSEEHELGVHALAVPIYNHRADVIAALNIVSPTTETTKDHLLQQILPLLQQTAAEFRQLF